MPFKLDLEDMERHSVELRMFVDKARRRFQQAEMSDLFEKIIKNQLPPPMEPNENEETFIKIDRASLDQIRRLNDFLHKVIDKCTRADQHETIQQILRSSLLSSRRKSIVSEQSNGQSLAERFCYFCGGDENSAKCASENHPTEQGETILAINNNIHNHDNTGFSVNEQQEQGPAPKRQRRAGPETPPTSDEFSTQAETQQPQPQQQAPAATTESTTTNSNGTSDEQQTKAADKNNAGATTTTTTSSSSSPPPPSTPSSTSLDIDGNSSQEIPMRSSTLTANVNNNNNQTSYDDLTEPQIDIMENPQMTPPLSTGAPTPDTINIINQQRRQQQDVALDLNTKSTAHYNYNGRPVPATTSELFKTNESITKEQLDQIMLKPVKRTKQPILATSNASKQAEESQNYTTTTVSKSHEKNQQQAESGVCLQLVVRQQQEETNNYNNFHDAIYTPTHSNQAQQSTGEKTDSDGHNDSIQEFFESHITGSSTPKHSRGGEDSCLSTQVPLVIDEDEYKEASQVFNDTKSKPTESKLNFLSGIKTVRLGTASMREYDEKKPVASCSLAGNSRTSANNTPIHSKSIRTTTLGKACSRSRRSSTIEREAEEGRSSGINPAIFARYSSQSTTISSEAHGKAKGGTRATVSQEPPRTPTTSGSSSSWRPSLAAPSSARARTKTTSKRNNRK